MSSGTSVEMTINCQNPTTEKLIRSKYADIMVKVDADIYHVDRLQLAFKSDYFEKLLTEDFYEKKCDLIELPVMDSDTFSTVLDIIYGRDLESVLNADNYVTLLMAIDYLQINIDLNDYNTLVGRILNDSIDSRSLDKKVFQLCEFVSQSPHFDDLKSILFDYLSKHLSEVRFCQEFLSLPLNHVVEIISSKRRRIGFGNVDEIRECSRICVEWMFHDVENRLPHGIKLINAAKNRFNFAHVLNDEDFSVKTRNEGEEITPDIVLRIFYKMLACHGTIIGEENCTAVQVRQPNEEEVDEEEEEEEEEDSTSVKNFTSPHEREKMAKFLENGDFYDVTVKLEGKTYKLHRYKLHSNSDYFAHISSSSLSETTRQPDKDEEYLLDVEGVDRASFELFIRHIYYQEMLTCDVILRILKIARALKINILSVENESWIKNNLDSINFQAATEILNYIRQSNDVKCEFLYRCLLCKCILPKWTLLDDFSPFCAISIDMLEDLLVSSTFHFRVDPSSLPADFCIDDPLRLLDICSKWVMNDVQNRYQFIPRIALAINGNCTACCDEYKIKTVSDWSDCSQQFVYDELKKVLSSTSLIPRGTSNRNSRDFKEEPIFAVTRYSNVISLYNAEFDEIASLSFSRVPEFNPGYRRVVSATVVDDNVFIAYTGYDIYQRYTNISFQVYNISSKKFTSLSHIPFVNGVKFDDVYFVVLNCGNNIYCCFSNGYVLKYLHQLNRWMRFWEPEDIQNDVCFASNGKNLYRMLRHQADSSMFNFYKYNFQRKEWRIISGLTMDFEYIHRPLQMTIINGRIAVFDPSNGILHCTARFHTFLKSESRYEFRSLSTITQCEIGILHVCGGKIYQLGASREWQLKKEVPVEILYGKKDDGIYYYYIEMVASIHRPNARILKLVS